MPDNSILRLPYAPGAARACLLEDAELLRHVPPELITARKTPDKITRPFILVRPATTTGRDPMLRTPMVQVDVFVPPWEVLRAGPAAIDGDPDEVAWDLAALCAVILCSHKARTFRNSTWTAKWKDGPGAGPSLDTSRGEDMVLHRALVRVELTMKVMEQASFVWDRS